MKILLISQYALPQPLANAEVIGGLARALGEQGHDVTVVSPVRGATESPGVVQRTAYGRFAEDRRSIPGRLVEYGSFTLGAAWSGVRAPRPDVVVVSSPPLTLGVVGALVARRHRRPLVYNVQDLYPEVTDAIGGAPGPLRAVLLVLARWVYRVSDAVVVIDPAFEGLIRRHAPHTAVRAVRNGIDRAPFEGAQRDEAYLDSIGVRPGRPVVMYAGNVGRSQDLQPVVAAVRAAGATLVVHGAGAALEDLRRGLDPADAESVRFSGFVERDRLGSVFASADLHVVPLKPGVAWASVPSKLLSIFSAGRPVVLAAEPGSPAAEVLAEADGGWLVAPGDAAALAAAIDLALQDEPARRRHGSAAQRWAEGHAGHDRMAREWTGVLQEVVGSLPDRPADDVSPRRRPRLRRHWTPRYVVDRTRLAIDQRRRPEDPWWTREAIGLLDDWVQRGDRCLEWGSGRSTRWLAERGVQVWTVEHDAHWAELLEQRPPDGAAVRVALVDPLDQDEYVGAHGELDQVDLAIVDGLHRGGCALRALELVRPGGAIVVDNVERYLPSGSRSPETIGDAPLEGDWQEFARRTAHWPLRWTSNGVTDTAVWFRPTSAGAAGSREGRPPRVARR